MDLAIDHHARILDFLERNALDHRIIKHPAEGNTIRASELRGHDIRKAAKAIVVSFKTKQPESRFALAVVAGDCRVDMKALGALFGARRAGFATFDDATRLTGCPMGAVPPMSFEASLPVVFDATLASETEIVFNAGRLDVSVVVPTTPFLAATRPRISPIGVSQSSAMQPPVEEIGYAAYSNA